MTDAQRQLLTAAAQVMRQKASAYGSMHPLWDMIVTAEDVLAGGVNYLPFKSVDEVVKASYDEARK